MIRILIAEDMHMIRGALVALLSLEDGMEVVAELDRGDEDVRPRYGRDQTLRCLISTFPGWMDSVPPSACTNKCLNARRWYSRDSASRATCYER